MMAIEIKVLSIFCLISWSAASQLFTQDYNPVYHQHLIAYAQPQIPIVASVPHQVQYNLALGKYDFSYGVPDFLLSHINNQKEIPQGPPSLLQGSYSIIGSEVHKNTYPQLQYLPVFQSPLQTPQPPQKPITDEQTFNDGENFPVQQQSEEVLNPANEDFEDSPQFDDSDVVDAIQSYGAAARGNSENKESILNHREEVPSQSITQASVKTKS